MKVRRNGRLITFVFSGGELHIVISAMRDISPGKPLVLTSLWEGGGELSVKFFLSSDEKIFIDGKTIIMNLEQESLEYAIHKIEEMLTNGSPSTPEFVEFRLQGDRREHHWKSIHTYFELERESGGA